MPMKEPILIKTVLGTGNLSLKADPGEAFIVRDILVRDPASSYLQVKIDKSLVGYFRVGGNLGGHQNFRRGRAQHSHTIRVDGGASITDTKTSAIRDANSVDRHLGLRADASVPVDVYDEVRALLWSGYHLSPSMLRFLGDRGIFSGFPIAEGQTLTLDAYSSANTIQMVIYEQWDPADVKPEMPNGSLSNEYLFLNYGNCGASVNVAGDTLYNTPKTPAEFPDFPFGKVVPAKHRIDILALAASTFAPGENEGTNYCNTKWLKLIKDRETLFDEDRQGLLFWARNNTADGLQDMIGEGFSMVGGLSEKDNNPPFIFNPPLSFVEGDELNIYLTTEKGGTGQNITIIEHEICLVEKVTRITG